MPVKFDSKTIVARCDVVKCTWAEVCRASKRKSLKNLGIHKFGSFIFPARNYTRCRLLTEALGPPRLRRQRKPKPLRIPESPGSFMRNSKETAWLLGYLGLWMPKSNFGRLRLGEALLAQPGRRAALNGPGAGKAERRHRSADGTELSLRSPESSTIPNSSREVRPSGRVGRPTSP